MRLYQYVGPKRIFNRVGAEPAGIPIHSPQDVLQWLRTTGQELTSDRVIATYVVDAAGLLRIADRRSEHVICAGGLAVRSAGEITFAVGREVEVISVSNQSTGYCPEPSSWPMVASALRLAGLNAPDDFALACDFRRCSACGNLTLVKGGFLECGVCGAELPTEYNCQ